ncbi:MAG: hypothetical protein ABLT11_00090 [Candidatus Acidiferrum sp.]
MEMEPSNPLKEIFDELFGLLESLETQGMAVTQFLKDQKIGNDKKLAPYLEQAGNASSVKWRAARARMEYLLAPMQKEADEKKKAAEKESEKNQARKNEKVAGEQPIEKQPSDRTGSKSEDRANTSPARENAEPAKKVDSNPARPETKEKAKPETERK